MQQVVEKPRLSFWQIWNMSFGFLGIQFGWSLQLGNMGSIYKFLGVQSEEMAFLWLAAPMTGLIVQPIIGYMSDRTWTKLGRRRPFFLIGAILSSIALILMPNSSAVWMAAGSLWILDASINISMEPFRAFVADMLPANQRTAGFAMQSVFIGAGSVLAFGLPKLLVDVFGIDNSESTDAIPPSIKLAFYIGSFVFIAAVLVTIFTTKEYPPADMEAFEREKKENKGFFHGVKEIFSNIGSIPDNMKRLAIVQFFTWLGLFLMWIYFTDTISTTVFEVQDYPSEYTQAYVGMKKAKKQAEPFFANPGEYMTASGLESINKEYGSLDGFKQKIEGEFGTTDAFFKSLKENEARLTDAGGWTGICFAMYSLITFIFGFFVPRIARRITRKMTHMLCLFAGGLGLISVYFITGQYVLLVSMVGVGLAWTSILTIPYSLLSTSIPEKKMGVFMGIFNFFIVIPEIIAALFFGLFLTNVLGGDKLLTMIVGGSCLILAGLLTMRVMENPPPVEE